MRCLAILLALLLPILPASAQTNAASPGPNSQSELPSDIVVNGLRVPEGPFATKIDTKRDVEQSVEGAQAAEDARFFSQCVKPQDNESLHELIDGPPHSEMRASALRRIIANYAACYRGGNPHPGPVTIQPDQDSDCHARTTADPLKAVCQSMFDRGALVERMLVLYAPDLEFTSIETAQPAVLARYHAREDRFNKSRSKGERILAEVAACVAAVHPDLALAYPRSTLNSAAETRLRTALIGTSPQCVGGATRVTIDPSQFRVFLVDALYSWAAALRGVDTLIPVSDRDRRAF